MDGRAVVLKPTKPINNQANYIYNGNRNRRNIVNKLKPSNNIILPKIGKGYENNIKYVFNQGFENSYRSEYNRKYFM